MKYEDKGWKTHGGASSIDETQNNDGKKMICNSVRVFVQHEVVTKFLRIKLLATGRDRL